MIFKLSIESVSKAKLPCANQNVPLLSKALVAKNLTSTSGSALSFSRVGLTELSTSSVVLESFFNNGIKVSNDFATLKRMLGIGSFDISVIVGRMESFTIRGVKASAIVYRKIVSDVLPQ